MRYGVMLSVIVPVYNIEKYVEKCIQSIISQTYRDLEIILVDDGSTDSSGGICDAYARIDSRIVVIHKENGGLVSARKAGLRVAKGEYITYVDGDDWIDDSAYENMCGKIKSEEVDMVFYGHFENTGNVQKEVHHNVEFGVYDNDRLKTEIYPRMIAGDSFFEWQVFPAVWDMIVKKELLEKSQYEVDDDIAMGEDAACVYPCLLTANKVCFEKKAFYHYRQTSDSMIKQKQDVEIERRKFATLYKSVDRRLEKLTGIYDVRRQWVSYVLFLMLPRADHLYYGYQELPFLFPYCDVKKGMKIAIYGAGTYGQRLYGYLNQTGFCDVIVWFDRNYEQLCEMGFDVKNPESITDYQFDGIIIANMFSKSRRQIEDFIKQKSDCQIYEIDEKAIFSKEYLAGFGLI